MEYKEVLKKLADSISHQTTCDKLAEFAKVAEGESNILIQLISGLGGNVESTERQTDQESISWVQRPLPDPENMQALLACLTKAERNKELDYNKILGHEEMQREHINLLDKHRREAETNLNYFQTALEALEHKTN